MSKEKVINKEEERKVKRKVVVPGNMTWAGETSKREGKV